MSNKNLEKLDSETRDVINYLKNRNEVIDLNIEDYSGATSNQINEWEVKNLCNLPIDLKNFYSNQNGMLVEWKFKLDSNTSIPLGRMKINSLRDLTKVGSVLNKDYREPSVFDLEDLQQLPEALQVNNTNSVSSFSSSSSVSFTTNNSNNSSSKMKSNNNKTAEITNQSDENTIESGLKSDAGSSDEFDNEVDSESRLKIKSAENSLVPRFDEASYNFELENCNGFGKVCLVYRNMKPNGNNCSDQTAEIWFLDRSLQWHFLTHSFQNYYRLLIAHLGLPQWQSLFTEDGLPPFLYQWYYMLAPGRILIHDNMWKRLDFLNIFEASKPPKSNQSQKDNNNNNKTTNVTTNNKIPNKIDFTKLFDENKPQSKNKSQNNNTNPSSNNSKGNSSSGTNTSSNNNNNNQNSNNLSKPKSKGLAIKK